MRIENHLLILLVAFAVLYPLTGCNKAAPSSLADDVPTAQSRSLEPKSSEHAERTSTYTYEIINTYPHDTGAFTQGLVFLNGALFESTGLNGKSSLRKVNLETGKVLTNVDVPAQYFAEGLAVLNGKLFQLTWKNHTGFVYDLDSFQLEQTFSYKDEGWGLTTDGKNLILSDGTDQIRFLDPITFEVQRTIHVAAHGYSIDQLNELEYIKGEIYANIWGADFVVRIDPATGNVTGVIDFTGLLAPQDRDVDTNVLNGIAYDADKDRLFITGKKWPKLFEVHLNQK